MAFRILSAVLGQRRNECLLKIPPYLSALCIIVGVVWLFLLPLDEYSRHTYVSENALLPGQVHTYFGGSEHNIFRAYRHEVAEMIPKSREERVDILTDLFRTSGLKVATQKYQYSASGRNITGENVYAVLQGPRADATEAVVLVAPWDTTKGEINYSGMALVLTLARYFKRWSLWSKDIIFLIAADNTAGTRAWVDAYHNAHASTVEPLTIKSGALQGAVAIEYPAGPWGHRFDKLHILYDSINGQLPNLDLFNTAVSIASGQMGIGCTLQRMWKHDDSYDERLLTMLRGMINQGLGHASGAHSSFVPYHVDAITLQTVGDGWHNEMSLGRTVESIFRSLNNLLEHLHQSFFFYLLMQANRFVSIGTYLPSAMLIAANFTITSIVLWIQSGQPATDKTPSSQPADSASPKPSDRKGSEKLKEAEMTVVKKDGQVSLVPKSTFEIIERRLSIPIAFILAAHFIGLLPLYAFNNSPEAMLTGTYYVTLVLTIILPFLAAFAMTQVYRPTPQEIMLLQCFSLMLLGMFLSSLATLNFSLSFLIGLAAAPLSFVRCFQIQKGKVNVALTAVLSMALVVVNPLVVGLITSAYFETDIGNVLVKAAEGWHVFGLWTQVVVWLVWWPAWFSGAVVVALGIC